MIVRLKVTIDALRAIRLPGFNSMIVRLKANAVLRAQGKGLRGFNSMIVRLKVEIFPSPKFHSLNGFNSMIVRLKDSFGELIGTALSCFNSMIVRLKENRLSEESNKRDMFQFYDSPIKSAEGSTIQSKERKVSIL